MPKYVNASITDEHTDNSLPILEGTIGPQAVDIQSMYTDQGLLAFDPGFRSTASCRSAITYVDGDEGILLYRGYPIEELAEKSSFLEVAQLLMYGELANEGRTSTFSKTRSPTTPCCTRP